MERCACRCIAPVKAGNQTLCSEEARGPGLSDTCSDRLHYISALPCGRFKLPAFLIGRARVAKEKANSLY